MKIVSSEQMRMVDAYTIKNEPISSVDLMERAATACFEWIISRFDKSYVFEIYAGVGNNGGDGLVLTRLLYNSGYTVSVKIIRFSEKTSADFDVNYKLLQAVCQNRIIEISEKTAIEYPKTENLVLIDAILGSGLAKPVEGFLADVIAQLNKIQAIKVALDMPTGLFSEFNDNNKGEIFKANYTLSLHLPKLAMLFVSNYKFVGEFSLIPIGLNNDYINTLSTPFDYLDISTVSKLIKVRHKFDYKGLFGHALLVAGSKGKMGAAVLSANACLRSGAGLVTVNVPSCGYDILQIKVPEAMCIVDQESDVIGTSVKLDAYNAIAIGPGIGTDKKTANMLKVVIQNANTPIVFDADAINILAENKTWLSFIPPNSIFTPHVGEFSRLIGNFSSEEQKMDKIKAFCFKYTAFLILKGAHSMICTPDGRFFFNSTGNPGMATAGSGDVLTGIVLSLLSQGYSSLHSSLLGVFIHGLAGDIASINNGFESLIASDIVASIGSAYNELLRCR